MNASNFQKKGNFNFQYITKVTEQMTKFLGKNKLCKLK